MVKSTENQNSRKSIGPVLAAKYESDYSQQRLLKREKLTVTSENFKIQFNSPSPDLIAPSNVNVQNLDPEMVSFGQTFRIGPSEKWHNHFESHLHTIQHYHRERETSMQPILPKYLTTILGTDVKARVLNLT